MADEEVKKTPILPFDCTKQDNFYIYDQVVFTRNISIMPDDPIVMKSPNMIKYYRCDNQEPIRIGGD